MKQTSIGNKNIMNRTLRSHGFSREQMSAGNIAQGRLPGVFSSLTKCFFSGAQRIYLDFAHNIKISV